MILSTHDRVVDGDLVRLTPDQRQRRRRILSELGRVGLALPGSVVVRSHRCGKQGCRCMAEPPQPHGPYNSWTRKIGGKTVTRLLNRDQLADYTPLFDASRRLRELVTELETLTLEIIEADDRWPRK
jgi:small ligand-binding sensory domain FIST